MCCDHILYLYCDFSGGARATRRECFRPPAFRCTDNVLCSRHRVDILKWVLIIKTDVLPPPLLLYLYMYTHEYVLFGKGNRWRRRRLLRGRYYYYYYVYSIFFKDRKRVWWTVFVVVVVVAVWIHCWIAVAGSTCVRRSLITDDDKRRQTVGQPRRPVRDSQSVRIARVRVHTRLLCYIPAAAAFVAWISQKCLGGDPYSYAVFRLFAQWFFSN